MSDELKPCPQCANPYGYATTPEQYACPECGHNWSPKAIAEAERRVVKDANGNELTDGDAVIVIKDLPVRGASNPIKGGTKVKNIRLVEGDHDIDCKVPGFGRMGLKSEFVKKA